MAQIVWLIYAMTWGSIHLFVSWTSTSDGSSNTWSFGQIMPLALLVAPLVSALEFFFPGLLHSDAAHNYQHLAILAV